MTVPSRHKQWVSLGLLFGGHPQGFELPPPVSGPPPTTQVTADEREAMEVMRAAGYEPKGPYPGARSMPWPSECTDCGASRKPSLQDIERGVRCKHVRRGPAASGA
jgi:hypothetical protein